MLRRLLLVVVVLLLHGALAGAETYTGNCAIRFFGDSTLHGFEGKAVCEPFTLAGENESTVIRQPTVTVRVDAMDTGNGSRDKKMRSMFDSRNYPFIKGEFNDLEPEKVLQQMQAAGDQPGRLPFTLRIRDQVQPVNAAIHDLQVSPEMITFTMKFPLSLKSFGLKPPSVLGLIKVADRVDVEVDATLQRQ